jgi:hypothetical protein
MKPWARDVAAGSHNSIKSAISSLIVTTRVMDVGTDADRIAAQVLGIVSSSGVTAGIATEIGTPTESCDDAAIATVTSVFGAVDGRHS